MASAALTHKDYMYHALDLARRGTGRVAPNPRVGCVIVHRDRIIAEGWYDAFGGPHAEVHALRQLESVPANATMYVTLEPCFHHGKTPPCADAIIASGIQRVVVGMTDPNPLVSGRGIERLRQAGIDVISDVCSEECQWINRSFSHVMTHKRPYVIAKVAQSLDGCVASWNGTSKWITSQGSRRAVHALRHEVDAVLTGIGTVLADDPTFTVRHVEGRTPPRIVLDTALRLSVKSALVASVDKAPVIVCCAIDQADSDAAAALRDCGCTVIGLPAAEGQLQVDDLFDTCVNTLGLTSIMLEAGPTLVTSMLRANAIHELHLHTAPILLGDGLRWCGLRPDSPSQAQRWYTHTVTMVDGDVHHILRSRP